MTRLVGLMLVLAGCGDLTQVLVSVDSVDLVVPTQVATLRITAGTGTDAEYTSQDLPLCATGTSAGCYTLPLTTTLVPGHSQPDAKVRVQVDALDSTGTIVTSDAATFVFATNERQRLDFYLSTSCLNTSCAAQDLTCREGTCVATTASTGTAPDMATTTLVPIERTSFTTGALTNNAGTVSVPKPPTEPGDIVLLVLEGGDANATDVPGAAQDWMPLGSLATYSFCTMAAHIATSGDDAAYVFAKGVNTGQIYATVVYRGAKTVQAGTNEDDTSTPLQIYPGPVSAGSIMVGVVVTADAITCSFSSAAKDVAHQVQNFVFEEGPFAAGSSPADTLTCGTMTDAGGSLFEVFLSP